MTVDFEHDLLLITAASGKQARGLLPYIVTRWKRLRLQCVSESSKERLQISYPDAEVVQAGFGDLTSAKKLLDGVTVCVLTLPAFHPRETHQGINMIDAAVEKNTKHLVFSSVIHPELNSLVNHESKRYVEEALVESGLNFTIVQPAHLMDNVPIRALVDQPSPTFRARFNPDVRFSFVNVSDMGEAVANILSQREKHYYATYQLVSTATPLSYVEAMRIVSEESGRIVQIEQDPVEKPAKAYANNLGGALEKTEKDVIERGVARMLVYYNSQGLLGNPSILAMLLGREPVDYREWVRKQLM